MIGPILALIPVAAAFSLVLTAIVRAAASRRGWFDTPGAAGHVKREVRRVPNVGGIGIFWAIALPILVVIVAARWDGGAILTRLVPGVGPHLAGLHDQTPMGLGLLGVLLALHLMGLADDRRALGAWPKLLVMALGAGVMVFVFDLRLLTLLDAPVGGRWLSITLTILWFLAVTNAINFIDNMDGLAGGVGVTAGTLFLIAAILGGQWFVAGVLALLVGALLGFLWFNFPWRRGGALIFMGDGGSLVVGFLLAFLTVRTTYVGAPEASGVSSAGAYAVFMPLCVLAVPLYDLASVSLLRIAQGRSPMVGDQQHFSHRLRDKGLTVRQTLAVICGCTAATGISGILLRELGGWQAALAGGQVVLMLVILGIYEHASWGRQRLS